MNLGFKIYLPIYLSFIFTMIMANVCHLRVFRFNLNISTGLFKGYGQLKKLINVLFSASNQFKMSLKQLSLTQTDVRCRSLIGGLQSIPGDPKRHWHGGHVG